MAVLPLTGKPVLIRSSEKATMMVVIHSLGSVWLNGSDISLGQDANSGENAGGSTNQPKETRNDHPFCQVLTILLTLSI